MTTPEPQLKNLKVLVNDVEYVNADYAEITVSDGPGGVRVQALPFKLAATSSSSGSSAIIEALTAAVQARAGAKAAASAVAAVPPEAAT